MRFARFGTTTLIACVLVLGVALPAEAATFSISIVSRTAGFDPAVASHAQGTTFAWTNNDPAVTHTSTQDSPLALWATGSISPGVTKSVTVASAGAYPYHCSIHPTMTGTVRVPVKVAPASGSTTTAFTVTMATTAATGNFVYDVQMRVGTGAWTDYKTGVSGKSVTFTSATNGTFSFRSRLRNTSVANATSGWSPRKTITVS